MTLMTICHLWVNEVEDKKIRFDSFLNWISAYPHTVLSGLVSVENIPCVTRFTTFGRQPATITFDLNIRTYKCTVHEYLTQKFSCFFIFLGFVQPTPRMKMTTTTIMNISSVRGEITPTKLSPSSTY